MSDFFFFVYLYAMQSGLTACTIRISTDLFYFCIIINYGLICSN